MKFERIDESYKKDWDVLVAHTPESGFMQTFVMAHLREQTNWESIKIGMFEKKKLVGGAIVLKFYYDDTSFLYIPEGPVFNYSDPLSRNYFDAFIQYIAPLATSSETYSTTHLRIEPRLQKVPDYFKNFVKASYNMEPKQTLLIDLSLSEEKLLSSMKPKGRYNIKVANRYVVTVRQSENIQDLDIFLTLYNQTEERNAFKGKDESYFKHLVPLILKDNIGTFYIAEYNGKPISMALVIFFGERVTFLFGGSADTDKEKMAPYLLQWKIIQDAKAKGYQWYDFWGIAEDEDDIQSSWYGFTKFKRQFGGQRVDFIGTYDLVYNKSLYEKFLQDSGESSM